MHQWPVEGTHALKPKSLHWSTSVSSPVLMSRRCLKSWSYKHVVRYQAQDWIHLQDHSQLTYQALLSWCPCIKSWCGQYQKAEEKGQAHVTSLSLVTSSASSIHQDALTAYPRCTKCGYSNPCPTAWPMTRNIITVVATIITLPSAEAVDPPDQSIR